MSRETMKTDYLIVGSSIAAVAAVEAIRERDAEGRVVVVSKENRPIYSRPLISYLLAGKIGEEGMKYRDDGFFEVHRVDFMPGTTVEKVLPGEHAALCDGGIRIEFGRCLVATGGRPFVPPIEGLDGVRGVFTHVSWDDVEATERYLEERGCKKAVVLGAGFIGIKAAEALRLRGLDVTVVELADRVLPQMLNEEGSRLVRAELERNGVEVVLKDTVRAVRGEGGMLQEVVLGDGGVRDADVLIVAVGVVPSTEVVSDTGVAVDRGILIDEGCRTSAPDVFAAGDVAQFRDTILEQSRAIPILPNASRQGRVAGTNMAGGDAVIGESFPMNSVSVFDLPVVAVGHAMLEGEGFTVMTRSEGGGYRRLVLKDDRVIGMLAIGDIERAGIITGLIRGRVDVGEVKDLLLTEEFGVITLPAEYRKHVVKGEGIEV